MSKDADYSTAGRELEDDSGDDNGPGDEQVVNMAEFDVDDGTDGKDAGAEARQIKIDFDRKEVKAWLQRFEIRHEFAGVKSQWLKRLCLENALPQDIAHCCKDLFSQTKAEASAGGALVYKECKKRLLKVYGPQPGEDFNKAIQIIMTGLPSQAAKDIRDFMCSKAKKFDGCCCATAVSVHWKALLHPQARAALANMDLKTNWDLAMQTADNVYSAVVDQPAPQWLPSSPTRANQPSQLRRGPDPRRPQLI